MVMLKVFSNLSDPCPYLEFGIGAVLLLLIAELASRDVVWVPVLHCSLQRVRVAKEI